MGSNFVFSFIFTKRGPVVYLFLQDKIKFFTFNVLKKLIFKRLVQEALSLLLSRLKFKSNCVFKLIKEFMEISNKL